MSLRLPNAAAVTRPPAGGSSEARHDLYDLQGSLRVSAEPADPTSGPKSRTCEKCASGLKHLGDFPDRLNGPATSIWRCYTCNKVVSEPL